MAVRRKSLNSSSYNTLGMFGNNSQSSGFGHRMSEHRDRTIGRPVGGIGRRNPSLTVTDLELSVPFENLKNIDKPHKKLSSKHEDHTESVQLTKISFTRTDRPSVDVKHSTDDVKRSTQEPVQSLVPEYAAVKRTPMAIPVPRYSDVKPSTQETVTPSRWLTTEAPTAQAKGTSFALG